MNERIKEVRKARNMTQQQLAEAIGLSRNYIAMIETGQRDPSDRTIADICRVCGVDEIWLRTGTGDMDTPKTRQEELAEIFAKAEISDDVKSRMIRAMAQLPDEAFPVFLKYLQELAKTLSEE